MRLRREPRQRPHGGRARGRAGARQQRRVGVHRLAVADPREARHRVDERAGRALRRLPRGQRRGRVAVQPLGRGGGGEQRERRERGGDGTADARRTTVRGPRADRDGGTPGEAESGA